MSNLLNSYTRILSLLHEVVSEHNFYLYRRKPKLSDKKLIALSLAAESLGIDSERYLFKLLPIELSPLIERSVYNRRRRKLAPNLNEIRLALTDKITAYEDYHLIDSMPIELCKFARARRSSICQEAEISSPDYGYCAAQNMPYYGYKLHAVCTLQGVIKSVDISKASAHDIHYLEHVKEQFSNCVLIGDKGYVSQQYQTDLFAHNQIKLETPLRRNQTNFKPFSPVLRKARKRIETLFSQLCDQFMIRRNYAKSFNGLATRVLSKVTALTIIQWLNQRNGRPLNHIKIAVN